MTDTATLVTVMRHGEVEGAPHVLRGKHPAPLSPEGWRQMQLSFAAANTPPFDAILSSTLPRCLAFAEKAATEFELPMTPHHGFEEIGFGDWEGLTPAQAHALSPALFERFQTNPEGLSPPNGEAFDAFRSRVKASFHACLADHAGQHVLIVTHAGVMRVLLSETMALPWRSAYHITLPPAGCFQLSCLPGQPSYLLSLNRGQPCAA